jgi:hypothetical protein
VLCHLLKSGISKINRISPRWNTHTSPWRSTEGPIRRLERGGSEWEPIKILLQRENSAYAPNSQLRIPTRVRQGRVVTSDLPTLGAIPKQSRSESETQEAKDLATLRITRWTVRKHRADCPRGCGGRSENSPRTSSTAPSITNRSRWARGPSAPPRTVRHSSTYRPRTSCNKNPPTKWIERRTHKNSRGT